MILSALMILAAQASQADSLYLGEPTYGGTGCPGGTAAVSLSPDQKSISILFDSYVAEAGGGRSFDRKNCNVAIPVHIPQGYSVAVFAVDYRGFVGLPLGGSAQLAVNYFLAGHGAGVRTQKNFYGRITSDYVKTDNLVAESLVWSKCGEDTILRTNTTLQVRSNSRGEQAQATVDSADISSGLVYHLQWKSCH